jgi:hypothetical protein
VGKQATHQCSHINEGGSEVEDIKGIIDNLRNMLRVEPIGARAAGEKLKAQFFPVPEDFAKRIDRAVAELERQEQQVITLFPSPVVTAGKQGRWYLGPSESSSPNWNAYRTHLEQKGWGSDVIRSIDRASTKITNELLCPNGQREGRFQGLVLGYVQCGKTANMAATIAKAADSGYRMVIVLAGMTNVLRQQTQIRLFSDVVCHNPSLWLEGTTVESDFRPGSSPKLPVASKGSCSLFVVKKNATVLRMLKKSLNRLSGIERKNLPTLIIDDECDQASINTAAYRSSVTRLNGLIRDLCEKLPRVTYVGYTATPYANVLMAETSVDGSRDLYPSEFIISLDEPEGYFGARRLFGDDTDAEKDTELPYIRRVPSDDRTCLQPPSRKERDIFSARLTPSLSDACDWFLLALAARRSRGQEESHCCMLIHTTIYAACHRQIRKMVEREWLIPTRDALRNRDHDRINKLRMLWNREISVLGSDRRVELDCPDSPEHFDEIVALLCASAQSITMTVENSESEFSERLDFNDDRPVHSIVIGGNVLARGLTIEGLVCSYFIRTSSQYDTLMQMGRWFGYRRGFEDLPRIWMTRELENAFRDLVSVEEIIRAEIATISRKGWAPSDIAVRVPQIAGLSVTARNKLVMENLEECDVSYYGTHEQTISFPVDADFHLNNWEAGAVLVNEVISSRSTVFSKERDSCLFRDVPYRSILRFLRSYRFDRDSLNGMTEFVQREIENGEESMEIWNVGVMGSRNGSTTNFGAIEGHSMVIRSKINPGYPCGSGDTLDIELQKLIYIKALMGAQDLLIDVDRQAYREWKKAVPDPDFDINKDSWKSIKRYRDHALGCRPLLLLYPIDRRSVPRGWSADKGFAESERLPLLQGLRSERDLPIGPLGVGVVFPEVTKSNARHYLRVKLNREIEGEALDDVDYELIEQREDEQ